jgi:predicted AAA+ superfamily ATPase
LRAIRLVLDLLRERVGSPVSYSSIAEDVQVSVNTVRKYIGILEALFIIFRVPPFTRNIARSLLKSPKIYFYDSGMVKGDAGARFENLAAACLLKYAFLRTDAEGIEHGLHYLRTKEGREVDFCMTKDGKPGLLVESKHSDSDPAKSLLYFSDRLGLPAMQVVMDLKREWRERKVNIMSAGRFLKGLDGPLETIVKSSTAL